MQAVTPNGPRAPHLWEAIISLVSLIIGIFFSIKQYGLDPQFPMILGVAVASLVALRCGLRWGQIETAMIEGIKGALPAIIILMSVGILIGIWILAGVVPMLVSYGLQVLAPSVFLPATVIICAVTSLTTGTSWGTSGTIGVALMGIGAGLGFPLPVVAGAVLSGAYFGDKLSPLSDTTNLAAAMSGGELYAHIRHMIPTSMVAIILTLGIEVALGLRYAGQGGDLAQIDAILTGMAAQFSLSPILILPLLAVLVASYRKVPAIPAIFIGITMGAVCAVIFQGAGYREIAIAAFSGYSADTGLAAVDDLLSRGGLESMFYTVSLILIAMMFGGVMERSGQLRVMADRILSVARSSGSLITATVLTGIGANLILCDQFMSIVMGGRTYAEAYRDRGLAPENLSRAVEDSATVTANLVPWNSGGAYQAATLGVATLAYLPFNFFCWLSPICAIAFAVLGIDTKPLAEPDAEETAAPEELS